MPEFDSKVAIVTGGGRGQGRSHAVCLAQAGAAVAICDITEQDPDVPYPTGQVGDLEETLQLIEKNGGRGLARVVDVRDHAAVTAFTREVADEFGPPNILVAQGIAADWVDISSEGRGPSGRCSLCRSSTRRSSSGMSSRSRVAVI